MINKYAVIMKEILAEGERVVGELDGFINALGYDIEGNAA